MTAGTFRFETGTATHTGRVREVNEDGLFADPQWGVWLVADGMGGHENGRLASSTIVEEVSTIGSAVSAPDLLARFRDRIFRANAKLLQAAETKGAETRGTGSQDETVIIGSTVAAVLIYGAHYACVWSGDSRIYLVRNDEIRQVTRDHTEAQELVDNGTFTPAEARNWPRRNVITRAVGIFDDPELDLVQGELKTGDIFVVCSDGLTGPVEDAEILHSIAAHAPQSACDALIDMALDRGARDNVTVVVVRCMVDEPAMAAPLSGEAA